MLWNGALRPEWWEVVAKCLAREIKGSGLKLGAVHCDEMSSFRLEGRGYESCLRKEKGREGDSGVRCYPLDLKISFGLE